MQEDEASAIGSHLVSILERAAEQIMVADVATLAKAAATISGIASSPVKCAEANVARGQLASVIGTFAHRQLPGVRNARFVGRVRQQQKIEAIPEMT